MPKDQSEKMRSETFILSEMILLLLPPQQATGDLESSVGVAVAHRKVRQVCFLKISLNKIPNSNPVARV